MDFINILDLFAGAGGFGLGFKMANPKYKILCSLEIDKWACDTLRENRPHDHLVVQGDIRSFDTEKKILSVCKEKIDLIIGGPPCQGFSVAGPTKDPKDPRNSLFKNFASWVKVHNPAMFVMENVRGLLNAKNSKGEKVVDIIFSTFESLGYQVTLWELNAANYGVPQNRERIFFVGNKKGLHIAPPPITHFLPDNDGKFKDESSLIKAVTVIDAIGDLPQLDAGEGEEVSSYDKMPMTLYQHILRGNSTKVYNHVTMSHTSRVISRYKAILDGNQLEELADELKVKKRNGNGELSDKEYNSNYRHLRPDMISYTIPASFYSNFIHPFQPRNITSREAARIQSFPDDYFFRGKRTQISSKLLKQLGKDDQNYLSQYNQIGNAVPPLLSYAIAKHILQFFEY